jgi:Kef-type K+ transport system membrane component KefB
MQNVWALASLWVGLALIATLLAIWFKISTALTEIIVGTLAQPVVGGWVVRGGLGAKTEWITFLAGTGAIVLTFLAGAELDPAISALNGKKQPWWALLAFSVLSWAARRLPTTFYTGPRDQVGWRALPCPQPPSRSSML